MVFWRRRKKNPQWIVVVSQIRPLDLDGRGRDELAWPEQRHDEKITEDRETAEQIATRLRAGAEVQAGRHRVKVLPTVH